MVRLMESKQKGPSGADGTMTMLNAMIDMLYQLPKALLLALVVSAPLIASQHVRAGTENIVEGLNTYSNGAGLVLVVSLKRAG